MEDCRCPNCLCRIPAYPCLLCGYDPTGAPVVLQAMEPRLLHGRYLTGRVLEKNALEIVYRGRDVEEGRLVSIREFFPAGKAERSADGSLRWTSPPWPGEALPPQRPRPGEPVLDSFSENNTIYTVFPAPLPGRKPRQSPRRENEWLPFLLALLLLSLTALAAAPWL